MEVDKIPSQHNSTVKPVKDYLIHGPIPVEDLAFLDFVESYLEKGIVATVLDVHFMLETTSLNGAPQWWQGNVAEFEAKFHDQYLRMLRDINKDSDIVRSAAQAEVEAKRIQPLAEDATGEKVQNFLAQGMNRLAQTCAVELLLDLWVDAQGK